MRRSIGYQSLRVPSLSSASSIRRSTSTEPSASDLICHLISPELPFKQTPVKRKHRQSFRLKLSFRVDLPDVRIRVEFPSRAAFIRFAPKMKLDEWERPFFQGRFLDLSTLASALTGEKLTLRRAAFSFKTTHKKSKVDSLGEITPETLDYGRNDVLVTSELFEKLREEYLKYSFATLDNERKRAAGKVPITELYSTASIAKALLRLMGFGPSLQRFRADDAEVLGWAMSAYSAGGPRCGRAARTLRFASLILPRCIRASLFLRTSKNCLLPTGSKTAT